MNKTLLMLAAVAIMAPAAFAHSPAGTPDRFCTGETGRHDYGPPAAGNLVFNYQDGNLEECGYTATFDGTVTDPSGNELADLCDANPSVRSLCDTDRTADYDGDLEFAQGGAVLAVNSGSGNSGSVACWGMNGHHSSTITVTDAALGGNVAWSVTADWAPTGQDSLFPCGDSLIDACDPTDPTEIPDVTCNPRDGELDVPAAGLGSIDSTATPSFGAGQDGTYNVFVQGTAGHIDS